MQQVGSKRIAIGADSGSLSLFGLSSTPRRVLAWVRKPVGGLNIFANIIDGSLTYDGFQFTLSGQTDNANYLLDFIIIL